MPENISLTGVYYKILDFNNKLLDSKKLNLTRLIQVKFKSN